MSLNVKLIVLTIFLCSIWTWSPIQCEHIEQQKESDFIEIPLSPNDGQEQNSIIFMGITGDLSRKKVMPVLWNLFRDDLLPPSTTIIGFGRSKKTTEDIRKLVTPNVGLKNQAEKDKYELFWKNVFYDAGFYDKGDTYKDLLIRLDALEKGKKVANRLYYLALPPDIYANTSTAIHDVGISKSGWTRLVIEKPFGRDLESSDKLSDHLAKLFKEDQIYRMDHYLGKEMVQNILPFRFTNRLFEPIWSREHIANVEILFKEPFGAQGRGGYFDGFGIIRDVVQNHLLQVLTLVAMDEPKSASGNDIRDEKVKVLRSMETLDMKDVVLGQYIGNPNGEGESRHGYLDEPDVPKNSTTATYSLTVLHINNTRWNGVPFFIQAGKALDESRVEVRIQLKTPAKDIFGVKKPSRRNMIVIRIQPNEAVYQRVTIKDPGMGFEMIESEIDLTYSSRYKHVALPDAYERLIPEVFMSSQSSYVRTDELREAWRVFTPALHRIDSELKKPINYMFGSLGPQEAHQLMEKYGLKKTF